MQSPPITARQLTLKQLRQEMIRLIIDIAQSFYRTRVVHWETVCTETPSKVSVSGPFYMTQSRSMSTHQNINMLPVVPRQALAEVSKIGNLYDRLVVVKHGWQSESTDGRKGGGSCVL